MEILNNCQGKTFEDTKITHKHNSYFKLIYFE